MVQYNGKCKICEFYVGDFPTAILGIHGSEDLKLITVHFNSIENVDQTESESPKLPYVNAVASDDDEFGV